MTYSSSLLSEEIALRYVVNDDVIYDAINGLLDFLEIKRGTSSYYSALIGISGAQADDDLRTEVASTVLIPFDATDLIRSKEGLWRWCGEARRKLAAHSGSGDCETRIQGELKKRSRKKQIGSYLNKVFEYAVVKREEDLQPALEVEIARHASRGNWRREKRKNNAPTRPHVGLGHLQQSRSVVPFLTDNTGIELASKIKSERDGEIREVYEKAFRMENEVKLVDEMSGEYMEGHSLRFGYREFSLITGYRFGTVNFDLHPSSDLKFGNTVFPNKIGFIITNLDIIGVIEDEERFGKLSDDDAIRLCLLLAVEVIFMGRLLTFKVDDTLFRLVENLEAWNSFPWGEHLWCHLYDEIKNLKQRHSDEHYYGLKKDRNYVPTYTLSGFVFAFQIWILETFERCESWWIKDPKVIPRALGWSKKSLFTRSDYSYLFAKESSLFSGLLLSKNNIAFLKISDKLEGTSTQSGGKNRFHGCIVGEQVIIVVEKKWLNDLVIMELNYRVFKLETIIQDYLQEEELRLCLEDEEMLRCEHEKLIVEENRLRLDEAKRLRLEEENMLQLKEQKKIKRKEFMNSSHGKNILAKLAHAKRNQLGSSSEKINSKVIWVKIKKYRQHVNDPCTAKLLKNVKPWVEIEFHGLKLVCLDPARKGWLTKELLFQKGLPLFYANTERYTAPWSEVDQVFIPINETGEHWCLAQFHILSGEVRFDNTGNTYDYDYRDWYIQISSNSPDILAWLFHMDNQGMSVGLVGSNVAAESIRLLKEFQYDDLESIRGMMRLICETQLKVQLPCVLERANVFQKKGIDPSKYTITFRLADNVPKQGGVYGDCGVWGCILLYRLAHGLSLDVDDPVDVALAYREKMV
ncbi:phospholipase-like protein [Tanacetum coccineum]